MMIRIFLRTFVTLNAVILTCCTELTNIPKVNSKSENTIRGNVVEIDLNSSTVEVEILARSENLSSKLPGGVGSSVLLQAQPGDLALLKNKSPFRGILQESFSPSMGKTFLLHNVWPDDPAERIMVNNVNRLLRRDTLSMGESMIRTIGDTLPPFALYDQDGEVITTDYFDGSITILNFIFSRCSVAEMCPASTMKMKKLQDLTKQTKVPHIRFLSITLDPEFDSPGVLKSYARGYNLDESNFKLCTSKKTVIDDLTRQFGIMRKTEKEQPLDHTMRTMIINSKRQIVYQIPGKGWRVEDFLSRLHEGTSSF